VSAEGARYYLAQAGMAAATGWTGVASAVGVVPAAIGAAAAGAAAGAVALERRRRTAKSGRSSSGRSIGSRSGRPGAGRIGRALNRLRGRPAGTGKAASGRPAGRKRPTGTGRPTGRNRSRMVDRKRPTGTGRPGAGKRPTGTGRKPPGRPGGTGRPTATKKPTGTGAKKTPKKPTGTGSKPATDRSIKTTTNTKTEKREKTMSQEQTRKSIGSYDPQTRMMTQVIEDLSASLNTVDWRGEQAGLIYGMSVLQDLQGALEEYSKIIRSVASGFDRPGLDPRITQGLSDLASNEAVAANDVATLITAIQMFHAADLERMESDATNALDRQTNMDSM